MLQISLRHIDWKEKVRQSVRGSATDIINNQGLTPFLLYVKPRMVEDSTATDFFETFMIGVALGYDYTDEIFNTSNHSHGPMIKLIFDLKNSDIGFCLYAKWKFNDENDNRFQSFPFGARVTFSRDFFALFAGLGNEPRYTDKKENVITAYTGLTFYFPIGMTLVGE